MPNRFDPKQIHRIEQAGAALEQVASLIASYRRGLIREGVPPDAATSMAIAMQVTLMDMTQPPPDDTLPH